MRPEEAKPVEREREQQLRAGLLRLEEGLNEAAIAETLRLLESGRFPDLTERHVRAVMEYQAIELSGERFFERAWSPGKEAGATLGFALQLGAEVVRDDLLRLRATLGEAVGSVGG
jgi:hypothetical protein